MSILDTIVLEKRKEIEMQKKMQPLGHIRKNLRNRNRDFFRCLKGKNNIIAEVKFKSPSMVVPAPISESIRFCGLLCFLPNMVCSLT